MTESNQLHDKVAATTSGGDNVVRVKKTNSLYFDYSGLIPFFIFSFIFILVFQSFTACAQSKPTDNVKLSLNVHRGYNLPEYQFIR